jgi:hypothetical protein
MKLSPEYYLVPVSLVIALLMFFALHLVWKPDQLTWRQYNPAVLYSLKEPISRFNGKTCNTNTITAFGGSILFRAFNARGGGWKWLKWNNFSDQLGKYTVNVISRQGKRPTFETLLPILDVMPQCKKTLIFQSNVFRRAEVMPALEDNYEIYFNTTLFHLRYYVEQLWPAELQSSYHGLRPISKHPYRYVKGPPKKSWKHRKSVRLPIIDDRQEILEKLTGSGAIVIILAIPRGQDWETAGKVHHEAWREPLRQLAEQLDGVEYLQFESLGKEMYHDHRHLNARGSDVFREWIQEQLSLLGR